MSAVAEAASLFGGSDSANDPFASSLGEDNTTTDPGFANSNDLFAQEENSAADFFSNTSASGQDLFASAGTASHSEPTAEGYGGSWNDQANYYSTPANQSTYPQQQAYDGSWNGQQNGWNAYEPQQHAATGASFHSPCFAFIEQTPGSLRFPFP